MDATIVIPTKNGGPLFKQVLDRVMNQKTQYTFEVVCIDSGSSDKTLDYIAEYPQIILKQIPKEEFGHGKTRNLGASLGTGDYIVFITQDALPENDHWLENFLNGMKSDPEIVGGFGRHIPYPDCNLLDKRDIEGHFLGFGTEDTVFTLEDPERYKNEEGYRHFLAFFSDNNACLKRSVWEQYPYDDVNFAEDQIWARKMIEFGFKKLYCPSAAVYHSHNFPLEEYRKRYFDEYKGLNELHQYVMVDNWITAIGFYFHLAGRDAQYIAGLDIPDNEKKYWKKYAYKRDWYRVTSALRAGKYHSLSPEKQRAMDEHFSQQLEQRRQ